MFGVVVEGVPVLMDGPETLHVVSLGGLWRPRSGRGMENGFGRI